MQTQSRITHLTLAPKRWGIPPCVILSLAVTILSSPAAPATFQSSGQNTPLLELYTSEGCSSCPPAESWLSRQKDSPGLWKEFVPVAFHVDYWDHLGWQDPWSANSFSARQRAHAKANVTDAIYTPEFFLNGKEWRAWSGRRDVPRSGMRPGVLTVTSGVDNRWRVTFAPTIPATRYEACIAVLSSGVSSEVKAGENRGRHLAHDFVALSLTQMRLDKKGEVFQGDFVVGLKQKHATGRLGLAVWVTRGDHLEPLQATGGWLPPIE